MRAPVVAKILLAAALLVAFILAVRLLPLGAWVAQFQTWVRSIGVLGYVVYVLVYVLFCLLFLPASPLTFGAGAAFGFVGGTIVVIVGATCGAAASFLLARTSMRKRIESMTAQNAKFRALDRAISREGAKIVFLVRLAPVFPFAYINFAFGLTGIRFLPYLAATFLGIIPATVAFVWISAAAARAATSELSTTRLIINIAGVVVAIVVVVFVTRIATRAIRRAGVEEET
ncbi:MAG TPA: TVP38/TMEM64 family protein [Thermoanaerobaculia bacterium]